MGQTAYSLAMQQMGEIIEKANLNQQAVDAALAPVNEQLADIVIDVKTKGAVADGETDDTPAINAGIMELKARGGGTLFLPYSPTPYMTSSIALHDAENITITGPPGTTVQILPGTYTSDAPAQVIDMLNCNNIIIENLTLDGNRSNINFDVNIPSHNIVIESCDRIYLKRVNGINAGMDGITTRFLVTNVYMEECRFHNATRNAMSVTRDIDGLYVSTSTFSGANGTAPQDGVDIEPTGSGRTLKNIYFDNCKFTGNGGRGFACDIRSTNVLNNVNLNNCDAEGNTTASIVFTSRDTAVCKNINVRGSNLLGQNMTISAPNDDTFLEEILIEGCQFQASLILNRVKKATVQNCTFNRSSSSELFITDDFENITINTCEFIGNCTNGIYRNTIGAGTAKGLNISNCVIQNKSDRGLWVSAAMRNLVVQGCEFSNMSERSISLNDITDGILSKNIIHDNSTGLHLSATVTGMIVEGNSFKNNSSNFTGTTSWSSNTARNNMGVVTEESGTAQITSGNTFVVVTVANSIALRAQDITVTASGSLGSAAKIWISDITTNTFRINVDVDPGATVNFVWRYARL